LSGFAPSNATPSDGRGHATLNSPMSIKGYPVAECPAAARVATSLS
jgi:hypothetical protein